MKTREKSRENEEKVKKKRSCRERIYENRGKSRENEEKIKKKRTSRERIEIKKK